MPYEPRYQWKQTQIDKDHEPSDSDWVGMDGDLLIGRIRKEFHGPTKGKWHWAAQYPKTHKGRPPTGNAGYADTARLATQKVEEYWDLALKVMEPRG